MSDEYLELKDFKKKNTKTAVKTRKFGKSLAMFGKKAGKGLGEAAKNSYQAVTSEKAKKVYRTAGKTGSNLFNSLQGEAPKKKTTTKSSKRRSKAQTGLQVVYVQPRLPARRRRRNPAKKKSDSWLF